MSSVSESIKKLVQASAIMVDAHTPSYSNDWQFEDGYGKSHRRDWRKDQKALEDLEKAIEEVKIEFSL